MDTVCGNCTGNNVETNRDIAPACPGVLLFPVYLFKLYEHRRRFKGSTATEEVYLVIPQVHIRNYIF